MSCLTYVVLQCVAVRCSVLYHVHVWVSRVPVKVACFVWTNHATHEWNRVPRHCDVNRQTWEVCWWSRIHTIYKTSHASHKVLPVPPKHEEIALWLNTSVVKWGTRQRGATRRSSCASSGQVQMRKKVGPQYREFIGFFWHTGGFSDFLPNTVALAFSDELCWLTIVRFIPSIPLRPIVNLPNILVMSLTVSPISSARTSLALFSMVDRFMEVWTRWNWRYVASLAPSISTSSSLNILTSLDTPSTSSFNTFNSFNVSEESLELWLMALKGSDWATLVDDCSREWPSLQFRDLHKLPVP